MTSFVFAGSISTAATTPIRSSSLTAQEMVRFKVSNNSANRVTIDIVYDGVVIFPGVVLLAKGTNANTCNYDLVLDTNKVLAVVTTTTDALTYYVSGGAV